MDRDGSGRWARLISRGATRRGFARAAAGGLVTAVAAPTSGASLAAQGATPAAGPEGCPATTPEQNKDLVRRYWDEVWTAGGDARVPDLLAPEEVHHWGFGSDTVGHAPFIERLRTFLAAFPDFRIRVDQLVAEEDHVVSRWTATATHRGPWLGIPATGRQVEYTGVNIFRIACGKIAESWGQADHLGLLRQLGGVPEVAIPVPGTPAA